MFNNMFSPERLDKLKRLFQDPEWKMVDELLREYIEPLKDIDNIDLDDRSSSVKGEIKARKHFYNVIDKFLEDASQIASGTVRNQDPRDSME